jgi:hypothetical protein
VLCVGCRSQGEDAEQPHSLRKWTDCVTLEGHRRQEVTGVCEVRGKRGVENDRVRLKEHGRSFGRMNINAGGKTSFFSKGKKRQRRRILS